MTSIGCGSTEGIPAHPPPLCRWRILDPGSIPSCRENLCRLLAFRAGYGKRHHWRGVCWKPLEYFKDSCVDYQASLIARVSLAVLFVLRAVSMSKDSTLAAKSRPMGLKSSLPSGSVIISWASGYSSTTSFHIRAAT